MTSYLSIIGFLLLLMPGNKQEHYYFWKTVAGKGCALADSIKIRTITRVQKEDSIILSYLTDSGQIRYAFPLQSDTATVHSDIPGLVINPKDKHRRYFIEVFDIFPNRKINRQQVQQYTMVGFVGERDETHYVDKRLVVFLVRQRVGPWRRYLQSTDPNINKELNSIIDATLSDRDIPDYAKRCK